MGWLLASVHHHPGDAIQSSHLCPLTLCFSAPPLRSSGSPVLTRCKVTGFSTLLSVLLMNIQDPSFWDGLVGSLPQSQELSQESSLNTPVQPPILALTFFIHGFSHHVSSPGRNTDVFSFFSGIFWWGESHLSAAWWILCLELIEGIQRALMLSFITTNQTWLFENSLIFDRNLLVAQNYIKLFINSCKY